MEETVELHGAQMCTKDGTGKEMELGMARVVFTCGSWTEDVAFYPRGGG